MIEKAKGFGAKLVAFGSTGALVGFLTLAHAAHAAVDSDVASIASTTVNTSKENILGILATNMGTVALVFAAVAGIYLLMRLVKRASK